MKWYRLQFDALPVTVHLTQDHRFVWTRICGVQLGSWFFGAIRGTPSPARQATATTDEAQAK
jgi:hypothetical protein